MSIRKSAAGTVPMEGRSEKVVGIGRKAWKFLAGTAVLCMALVAGRIPSRAEAYAYTVTFYPGNHGTFQGTGNLSVNERDASDGLAPVQDGSYQIEQTSEYIRVTGLKAGQYVVFGDVDGAVKRDAESRYYVRGIRVSGRDNSTVDIPAFPVEGDRDYVVAYGIEGEMTSYVVNYQDEAGNTLAPSSNYFGNIGDKPVVAFLYIEGFQPQAYNLTKTLSRNTAENVFTFTYRRIQTPVSGSGGTGAGMPEEGNGTGTSAAGTGAGEGTAGTGTTPGEDAGTPGGVTEDTGVPGGAGDEDTQTPDAPDESQGGEGGNPGENGPSENTPQEVVDLDDDNVPLAGPAEGMDGSFRFPMWGSVCIAVTGAAIIGVMLWFMLVRRKKVKAEDSE